MLNKSEEQSNQDSEESIEDSDLESPDKDQLDVKYWKSHLIKDGLGCFLNP